MKADVKLAEGRSVEQVRLNKLPRPVEWRDFTQPTGNHNMQLKEKKIHSTSHDGRVTDVSHSGRFHSHPVKHSISITFYWKMA